MKRLLSAVLAAAMLLCVTPAALAASDIDNHWSKTYFSALHEIGVINPSSSGNYTPDQAIMRWEFMRYINRAFGFTEKADISFTDVSATDVYYDTVRTAVRYGYINGVSSTKMDPTGTLTREQAATILGRLHKYMPTADFASLTFTDKENLYEYSRAYVAEAVKNGYINGYSNGTFRPKGTITRAEIAKILYYFVGSSLRTSAASYTADSLRSDTQNVTVSAPCTLSNAKIKGNLYITEGALTGGVQLNNVTVDGKVIVAGGNVTLNGVSAPQLVVSDPLGIKPEIICTGETSIGKTEIKGSCALRESNLAVSAGGLSDLTVDGEDYIAMTLDAAVWDVDTESACAILTTGSTSIGLLTANAKTTVSGGGAIYRARLNVSGCELLMTPDAIELAGGVSATVGGESVTSSTSVSVNPSVLIFDAGDSSAIAHSYDFTFNADKNDLLRVTVGEDRLRQGTDYNLLPDKNGIRIYKTYLTTLKAGVYTAELEFEDGSKAAIGISASGTLQNAVSPSQITFDKYEGSANYADMTVTLSLPVGTQISSVKLGSTVLERGADYTYNVSAGTITLLRETLAKKSKGSYTITFVPSKGSSFSCALTVTDSSPKNELSSTSVDFDANPNSGGYTDLTVTLSPVEGATLKNIRCGGKTLEENWQYKVEGSQVTINRSAVAEFGKSGASYADFTFVMSGGISPTLRVNYVTTYALTANVTDDMGQPVRGASVTFTAADVEEGISQQSAYTDENGKATVYVKRGTYVITVAYDRFTAMLTQSVNVSSSRTVNMTGEILETVQIVVTGENGAMLSGALVSIGGKVITTGLDGTATFSLKRGNYVAQVSCAGYTPKSVTLMVSGSVRERVIL